jgi:hypothetical protein
MKHHILYLFLNIPLITFVKIGVTGKGKATTSGRAKQVSRAMPGVAIPVGIMFIPFFARPVEQAFHAVNSLASTRFYKGDGSTEWFWILAAVPYYILMLLHFQAWMWAAQMILK